jgi:hypothetical protein
MVRCVAGSADLIYVKPCREYLEDNHFGSSALPKNGQANKNTLFTYAGDVIADADVFTGGNFWDVNTTTNSPIAEVTSKIAGSHSLRLPADDVTDTISCEVGGFNKGTTLSRSRTMFAAGKTMVFQIRHLDSDATKLLTVKFETNVDKTAYYWTGSAWSTTLTKLDITGSATDATFLEVITGIATDEEPRGYKLTLEPKIAYAGETFDIDNVGLHDEMADVGGALLGAAGSEIFITAPWRFRIGADSAANTPDLNLCIMRSA